MSVKQKLEATDDYLGLPLASGAGVKADFTSDEAKEAGSLGYYRHQQTGRWYRNGYGPGRGGWGSYGPNGQGKGPASIRTGSISEGTGW